MPGASPPYGRGRCTLSFVSARAVRPSPSRSSSGSSSGVDSGAQDSSTGDSGAVDSGHVVDSSTDSGSGKDSGTAADAGCGCATGQVCDQFGQCIDPAIIDDFAACVTQIPQVAGRSGTWYSFASTDVGLTFGVSAPPGTGWADTACGAWAVGGATTVTATDYAGIGVTLNLTSTYSLAGYTGLLVEIESSHAVWVQLKLLDGDYFRESIGPSTGVQTSRCRSRPWGCLPALLRRRCSTSRR